MQEKCTRFFQFLWFAAHGEMSQLFVLPSNDDKEVISWRNFKHEQCLGSVPQPTHQPQTQITSNTSNASIELTLLKSSLKQYSKLVSSESKKKSFEQLHALVKSMIIKKRFYLFLNIFKKCFAQPSTNLLDYDN